MRTSRDVRRRILLYFFLGIALPSGLLGYLALRGIRNDEALLERERREQSTRIARAAVASVEERLAGLAASLAGRDASQFPVQDSLVQAAFVMDSDGRIAVMAPQLLYLAEESRPKAAVADPALFVAARLAANDRRYREAARYYERLATQFALARTGSGLAVGPSARLELAAVLAAAGDTIAAERALRDLYRSLLDGRVPLTRSEYTFFAGQAREGAARYGMGPAELLAVAEEETAARRRTEELLAFAAAAEPVLPVRLRTAGDTTLPARRTVVEGGGRSFHLLAHPIAKRGWKGLLLDTEILAGEVSRVLTADASDTARWVLRGPDRRPIAASAPPPEGTASITLGFGGGFPPWVLELHQRDPSLLQGVFAPGRRVYLFAFVLLAGILLFGLTLTARVVSRELELARMKSDFVATVSHEFRSPLTAIRQLAAMLGSGQVPSEERRQRYYEVLLQESERLSHLVENVLEAARMDDRQGTLRLEPVDVRALVEEVTAAAQQRAGHEGFRVVVEVEGSLPPAWLDRETFARALGNLIDNAIKYSGASRNIMVRGFRENAHLVLSVRDWGAGLHRDEQEKVFERFYRGGDEMTRSVPGSGLGLTLVKKIVEAHGGVVRVESTLGQGSTFTIHLPIGTSA
jgi:signal transduction histidine kinase